MNAAMLAALALCAPAGDAVLVQFLSPACPHCKAMEPIVNRLVAEGCPVQAVDVDQQPDVAKQFKVTGVPTFVALSKGRETGRIVGATSYDKLLQLYRGAGGKQEATESVPSPYGLQTLHETAGSQALAPQASGSEQAALAASVRLKVEDATGFGFGTGTIIDTHENEALVVTCGHLFRESKGKGKITADVFAAGSAQTVEGQLIEYDLDRDIALVSLRVPFAVQAVAVAPPGFSVRPGEAVFSVGCDRGQDPTVRRSQITAVNKYVGRPNYTAAGQPVDGRSGGGLFSADGMLIGICNAADPADDEGLYAALPAIHSQLDQIGQSEIYQRAARGSVAVAQTSSPLTDVAAQPLPVLPASYQAPATASAAAPSNSAPSNSAASNSAPSNAAPGNSLPPELAPVAVGDDTEIVFIVRSKRDPSQRSEVYVVDQAPPDLVARITHAARQTGQQRAAMAQARSASLGTQPLVRGQSDQ